MNRFVKIFETALSNRNQEVTATDVNEVLSKLKDEAMAPGSLTSGDSTLIPLRDDEEEVSEESTTAAVAGFNRPKKLQQKDGQKLVVAKMIADAFVKACGFGDESMTFDNLEEFRSTFAEKRRLKNYPRRKERFGRDPLGREGLKPDELTEELPKDGNGALAVPHTMGRIAIGKIVS